MADVVGLVRCTQYGIIIGSGRLTRCILAGLENESAPILASVLCRYSRCVITLVRDPMSGDRGVRVVTPRGESAAAVLRAGRRSRRRVGLASTC